MLKNNLPMNHRGFTLLELLIGITLLSLIMLLLFSSLHTTGKSWAVVETRVDQNNEYRIATDFIRRQLAQAVPLIWASNEKREIMFHGKNNEVHFAGTLPAHRGGGGLHLLTIKLLEQDDQNNLVLLYQPVITGQDTFKNYNSASLQSAVIAENIKSLEFSYFGASGPDDEPDWRDEWDITEQMPDMVRVNITTSEPERDWPELNIVIHPRFVNGQRQFMQYPQG